MMLFFTIISCENNDDSSTTNNPNPTQTFNNQIDILKTFGGSQDDDALSIISTQDGHIAVLGYTQSTDGDILGKTSTDSDYWLLKLDTNLNILWQKTYGGTSDDRGQDIVATADGGFLLTGFTRSQDGDVSQHFGFQDYWVLKLDSLGNIIWEKTFGFSGNDRSFAAIQTNDGGYFVGGFLDVSASDGAGNDNGVSGREIFSAKHGVGEFWGIRLNSDGQTLWRRYFGGTNNDRAYDVIQAHDGNFMMVGNSESEDFNITNPKGSYDIWVVKINQNGELLWQKNFGGTNIEIGYSIDKTLDGNYIISGDTRSNDNDVSTARGNADYWLLKINDSGNILWEKTYGGSDFDSARDSIELSSGNLLLIGNSKSTDNQVSNNFGQNDFWVVQTSPNGDIINETSIGGTGLEFAQKSIQLKDGSVFVVGNSESSDNLVSENKGNKDALILKMK